jgi:hypothetical protein
MQAIKQQVIEAISKLPDTVTLEDIMLMLEKIRYRTPGKKSHSLDEFVGALGTGRQTEDIMAELRDDR